MKKFKILTTFNLKRTYNSYFKKIFFLAKKNPSIRILPKWKLFGAPNVEYIEKLYELLDRLYELLEKFYESLETLYELISERWNRIKRLMIDKGFLKKMPTFPLYRGHWFWKGTLELSKDPIQFYIDKRTGLGDTFLAKFVMGQGIISSDPGFIKHVLQTNYKNYPRDRNFSELGLFLGKGLLTSRGDIWRKQRRIAQPTFYKKSLIELYKAMTLVVQGHVNDLSKKKAEIIDISREMMAIISKIAMKTLFSKDLNDGVDAIYNSISYAQEYVVERAINPMTIPLAYINGRHRKFKKEKKIIDDVINNLIDERRKSGKDKHDFLQMLMDARYEDAGEPMNQRQLIDELITIFSAGHETSANALGWAIYLLSQHPEISEKIREEANIVFGKGMPSYEDLKELTYTKQVIEESMRVYPPVWVVSHYAEKADQWNKIKIKKGTVVLCHFYGSHHNPNLWEDPSKFNPNRFNFEETKVMPKEQ